MDVHPVDRRHRPHCHDPPSSLRGQRSLPAPDHRGHPDHPGHQDRWDHPSGHPRIRDDPDPDRDLGHLHHLGHRDHLARRDLLAAPGAVALSWGSGAGHPERVRDPCPCFG